MEKIYELSEILDKLEEENEDNYFLDFLNTKNIEAGILRLHKDQPDTQSSHNADEIYYVIEGEGFIRINGKSHAVKKGTSIYIPSDVEHRFYGNKSDLTVLYVLVGK
jgi:mannose-6-phosphate isomerase-like protein (cupin superfamily)